MKACLETIDPQYPLQEWEQLLPQCELTLNLLRTSSLNPNLSAWEYLFGVFDYRKTPLVPPGTKIVVLLKPEEHPTWHFNGIEGWSIGPSFDHYRCIKCYFPATRSERHCDTVTFFPNVVPFPRVTTNDFLKQAALDMISRHLWSFESRCQMVLTGQGRC